MGSWGTTVCCCDGIVINVHFDDDDDRIVEDAWDKLCVGKGEVDGVVPELVMDIDWQALVRHI